MSNIMNPLGSVCAGVLSVCNHFHTGNVVATFIPGHDGVKVMFVMFIAPDGQPATDATEETVQVSAEILINNGNIPTTDFWVNDCVHTLEQEITRIQQGGSVDEGINVRH